MGEAVISVQAVKTEDYHTGGEPFRIVSSLPFDIAGATVAERRITAMNTPEVDGLRRLLCFEPRGHADMYGCFITPPNDSGADFGALFWHKDGFSTACGHGTIALGVWAIETGLVARDASGITEVTIDVPSGRVIARVHATDAQITSVDFINVASYLMHKDVLVKTSLGEVSVDISFGGAIYAQLDAAQVNLTVTPENFAAVIAIGREIKWLLNDSKYAIHPSDSRLSGIYGTIVYEKLAQSPKGVKSQRNATIFADGELDRSPCGSGTCARLATLVAREEISLNEPLLHSSIVGSEFIGIALSAVEEDGYQGIAPQVSGMAYKTGESTFTIDPYDPLVPGFVLR